MQNLIIETLFINSHSQEREEIRDVNKIIEMFVIKQVGKNGKEISFKRGVVKTVTGKNIIMNIYENRKTKQLYAKTLTILTPKQLSLSNNMNKGKREPEVYNLEIKKVEYQESYFEKKYFKDFLND